MRTRSRTRNRKHVKKSMRTRATWSDILPPEPTLVAAVAIAALASMSLCTGCAVADDAADRADAGGIAGEPIPLGFALDGRAEITARWWIGDGWDAREAEIDVRSAHAALRTAADGAVTIDALRVRVGGITLGDDDLRVADIELSLACPAELGLAAWDGDGTLGLAEGLVDLELTWALAAGDDHLPLAPQTIDDVELRVGLRRGGDEWSTALTLERDGRAWAWADLFELSDLWIGLTGGSQPE
jgi:hypothetical protein